MPIIIMSFTIRIIMPFFLSLNWYVGVCLGMQLLSVSQVSTFLSSQVTSEGADEDCVDGDSEERVDQADSSSQLCLQCNPSVPNVLKQFISHKTKCFETIYVIF